MSTQTSFCKYKNLYFHLDAILKIWNFIFSLESIFENKKLYNFLSASFYLFNE